MMGDRKRELLGLGYGFTVAAMAFATAGALGTGHYFIALGCVITLVACWHGLGQLGKTINDNEVVA